MALRLMVPRTCGGTLRFVRWRSTNVMPIPPINLTIKLPRADRARNRARLLAAAKKLFAGGGPSASLECVARRTGVGVGTLYPHFPTREALFGAVYRHEVDQLVTMAAQLGTGPPPRDALRRWLHAVVEFTATKKGMSAALAIVIHASSDLTAHSMASLIAAAGPLLAQAIATGAVRDDISAEDLLRTTIGLCYTHDKPGWQGNVCRLVDVFVDGMEAKAGDA